MDKIDKSDFRRVILETHSQFDYGIKQAKDSKIEESGFDSIVVCGMGGSQMPGYFLNSLINTKGLPVFNHANYGIPEKLTKKPLFIATSFSGNTEETLDSYENIKKQGHSVIVFSNGGKLEELARENNDVLVSYEIKDPNFQPRCATPMTTSAMATVLENSSLAQNAIADLQKTAGFLKELKEEKLEKEGGQIAESIGDRI
ncbi:MAG: hypothetical protein GF347_00435, partial [Candidatus Moranbacteria bacterium]|nr:hypothetical protein [Candidatus Moranbacteria bacterium]